MIKEGRGSPGIDGECCEHSKHNINKLNPTISMNNTAKQMESVWKLGLVYSCKVDGHRKLCIPLEN